jgi:hypothetical protein
MRKTIAITFAVSALAFVLLQILIGDFTAPLEGGLIALIMCTIFYTIDRWGFNEIDTIKAIKNSSDEYHAYSKHLRFYAVFVLAGFAIAYYANH